MTAVQVSMSERRFYGSNYIGVADSNGTVTPRKLASSLATPAPSLGSTVRPPVFLPVRLFLGLEVWQRLCRYRLPTLRSCGRSTAS